MIGFGCIDDAVTFAVAMVAEAMLRVEIDTGGFDDGKRGRLGNRGWTSLRWIIVSLLAMLSELRTSNSRPGKRRISSSFSKNECSPISFPVSDSIVNNVRVPLVPTNSSFSRTATVFVHDEKPHQTMRSPSLYWSRKSVFTPRKMVRWPVDGSFERPVKNSLKNRNHGRNSVCRLGARKVSLRMKQKDFSSGFHSSE